MSRTKPTDVETIALDVPCDYCYAIRGVWCTATAYTFARDLHQLRTLPVYRGVWLGLDLAEIAP